LRRRKKRKEKKEYAKQLAEAAIGLGSLRSCHALLTQSDANRTAAVLQTNKKMQHPHQKPPGFVEKEKRKTPHQFQFFALKMSFFFLNHQLTQLSCPAIAQHSGKPRRLCSRILRGRDGVRNKQPN
jgi:hypothetical protein